MDSEAKKLKIFWAEDDHRDFEPIFEWEDPKTEVFPLLTYVDAVKMLGRKEHFDIFIIDLIFRFSPVPEEFLDERFRKILSEAQLELEQIDFLQKSIFWGRKLIENIQSIPQYASTPIVALSAVANAISEKVQKDLHICDIIPKRGLRIEELKRRVISAIRGNIDDSD